MSKAKAGLLTLLFIVCISVFPEQASAAPATSSTTLSIAPGSSAVAGTAVTLTAAVTQLVGGTAVPLTQGIVVFCNANAAFCEDSSIYGTAQLTSAGTATIRLTLGVGSYSITAEFQGTSSVLASVSGPQPLTVTANASYSSFTSIAASGGVGNYTLTGTVAALGKDLPTGTVLFLDTSNGNSMIGTAGLNPATLGFTLLSAPGSPLTVGQLPQAAVMGDFNNDGKLDLAVLTNTTSEEYGTLVSIQLGNGDGTFQPPVTYPTNGAYSPAMAMGDFNGDGNLDLAFADEVDSTISILFGNGDGTFRSGPVYALGAGISPNFLVAADFNHDGNPDLAVLSFSESIFILLGQGDGTFQLELQPCGTPPCPPLTFPAGPLPIQMALADLNGDGNADLVVVDSGRDTFQGGLSVLLGLGDGTFLTPPLLPLAGTPSALVAADFNRDGFPDIALTSFNQTGVDVLLANGDGTFQPPAAYATSFGTDAIATGDFQGTGQMDLMIADIENAVSLLLNHGDGTGSFQSEILFPAGTQPIGIAVGDLNGDGLPDLAVLDNANNQAIASGTTILLAAQTETAIATGAAVYGTGIHNLAASYSGDAERDAGQSSTVPLAATAQTVSATILTAAPNPAIAGQAITLTATVTPAAAATAGGLVNFYAGAAFLGASALNPSAIATLTTNLPAGVSSLSAVYSGTAALAASTSVGLNVTVNPIQTATTLVVAPNPVSFGQAAILTATVAPAPAGVTAGTVNFYGGTTLLGTSAPNPSGLATFATSNLPSGSSILTAVYSGSAGFAASTSTAVSEMVTPTAIATSTALVASMNPVAIGQSLTLTATVSPVPTGNLPGTVSFYSGSTWLGVETLGGSGAATFTTSNLGVGSDHITAAYSGNEAFGPSTSSAVAETVTTAFTVTAPAASVTLAPGTPATLTIAIPPVGGTFNGVVTLSTFGLPPGATASFNPPTVTPGSAGAQSVLTIQPAAQSASIPAGQMPPRLGGIPGALFSLTIVSLILSSFTVFSFSLNPALNLNPVLCGAGLARNRLPRAFVLACVLTTVGVATSLLTGCGSGGAAAAKTPPAQTDTQYTLTVIGTSGSFQASTTVTVVVQ